MKQPKNWKGFHASAWLQFLAKTHKSYQPTSSLPFPKGFSLWRPRHRTYRSFPLKQLTSSAAAYAHAGVRPSCAARSSKACICCPSTRKTKLCRFTWRTRKALLGTWQSQKYKGYLKKNGLVKWENRSEPVVSVGVFFYSFWPIATSKTFGKAKVIIVPNSFPISCLCKHHTYYDLMPSSLDFSGTTILRAIEAAGYWDRSNAETWLFLETNNTAWENNLPKIRVYSNSKFTFMMLEL